MRVSTIFLLAAMVAGCGPGTWAVLGGAAASSDDDDDGGKGRRPRPPDPPTGQADLSFGITGFVTFAAPGGAGGYAQGYGVTVDDLGRILVSGEIRPAGTPGDMAIWRFHADGTADLAFGGQGWVTHDSAAGGALSDCGLGGVAVDSLGRIVVAGRSYGTSGDHDVAVWRYLDSGIIDLDFAGTGYVTFDRIGDGGHDIANDIALLPDDKILVAGQTEAGNRPDIFVLRLDPDGHLDHVFGASGVTVHGDMAGVDVTDLGLGLAIDGEGRILVSGSCDFFLSVWRFTADGGLDPTFGTGGYILIDLLAHWIRSQYGEALSIAPDGRIWVAGTANTPLGNSDMFLWRLEEDGFLDLSLLGKGYVGYDGPDPAGIDDRAFDIAIDPAGGLVVTGYVSISGNQDMALLRYHPDGHLDAGFGTDGVIIEDGTAGGTGNDQGQGIAIDGEGRILVTGWSTNAGGTDDMVLWRYE